jgi:hypothetical protein
VEKGGGSCQEEMEAAQQERAREQDAAREWGEVKAEAGWADPALGWRGVVSVRVAADA